MSRSPIPLPFTDVFSTTDLASAGVTRAALIGWRLRQEVSELSPGVYAPGAPPDLARLRLVHASRPITEGLTPVTTTGAAVLHQLATPRVMPAAHHRRKAACPIPDDCLVRQGRLLTPSKAWTALQLTRWQALEGALIPLDSALAGGVSVDELKALAERMQRWPGTSALARALEECTALSGSALESSGRGRIITAGLPRPLLQQPFRIHGNTYYADFWWPEFGVVGEADGTGKYKSRQVVWEEKRRQGALHSQGLHVVRWGWAELEPSDAEWLAGLRKLLRR